MKRTPLKPRAKKSIKERTRIARKARKAWKRKPESFARIYGSVQRAKTMRERPCDICGRVATENEPNQNVHTAGGGTGRKAGWETVITGCEGCHRAIHWIGSIEKASEVLGMDLRAIAARLAVEIPA